MRLPSKVPARISSSCARKAPHSVLQFADDAGSHVNHFLVFVSHFFVDDALAYLLLDIFIEETQQQVLGLGKGKNL